MEPEIINHNFQENDQSQAIFNTMAEGVVVYDHSGKIIQFNPSALRILGMTAEQVLGKQAKEADFIKEDLSPLDPEELPSAIARKTGKPQINKILGIHHHNDGTKWVSATAIPLFEKRQKKPVKILVTFFDISQEKYLQEQLKRRKAFLNVTLNSLPILVSYIDKELRYQYVNHVYEEWFNKKKSEIEGKKIVDVLGQEVFEFIKPYVEKVFTGKTQNIETELNYQNVGKRSVQITLIPDEAPDGICGYYAIINDITELILAKEAIRKSEEEQRKILDTVPVFIAHYDKDLTNILSNKAYADLFETTVEKAIGKNAREVVGPDLYVSNIQLIEEVLSGKAKTIERIVQTPEGKQLNLISRYIPEYLNDEVIGYFMVSSDVTDLKRSEAKFKKFLELAPDPTLIIDEKGNIDLVNRQTETLFGYKRDELIGSSIKSLLPTRYHHYFNEKLKEYIKAPNRKTYGDKTEICAVKKDGTEFPFEVSIGPLQTEGKILIKCVVRDISERLSGAKEKEILLSKEFKARKSAEEAIRMRNETMAIVSHDLKNPLSTIIGYVDLLILQHSDSISLVQILERVRRSSYRMLDMIRDLLDIHKIESGHFDIESGRAIHDVESLVYEVFDSQQLLANNMSINLVVEVDKDLPPLSLNQDMIFRVFQNLIGNSLKFTRTEGTIKIKVERSIDSIHFSVSDTGPGIEAKMLSKIFDPFVQVKATSHLGSGLGLPICRAIVEEHGGKIWVESESGKGCKFTFSIPVNQTSN